MVSTSISYTAYSMNQVTEMAETIEAKQIFDYQRSTEEFEIIGVELVNNQFNMTIKNTGDIPVQLTRLWVENSTTPTWPAHKYDLNFNLTSGNVTTNIGQNIDLSALDTQSYVMDIFTDRGSSQKMFLNSVGEESLYLNLRASPTIVSDGFTSTLVLEVVNTGTTKLLNLQPQMLVADSSCIGACSADLISGPFPTSLTSLDPGNTANFEWVYAVNGAEPGDAQSFTASLVNGIDNANAIVSVQTVDEAINADISLISGGIGSQTFLGNDILIFHEESSTIDGAKGYYMYSGTADGGGNGDRIELDNETPHFFTNNNTLSNRVPAGDWDVAMMLKSDPVGSDVDTNYDMIFHFEDGDGVNPDNSQGSSARDLMGCGIETETDEITNWNHVVRSGIHNEGDVHHRTDQSWEHNIPLGLETYRQTIGLIFDDIDISEDEPIISAYVTFQAAWSTSNPTHLRIYGEKPVDGHADDFPDTDDELLNRDLTTAYVDWSPGAWVGNGLYSTPDISSIIAEITEDSAWDNNQHLAIIIYDHPDTPSAGNRYFEGEQPNNDNPAPSITITHGYSSVFPDWQDDSGPHGSGSYLFDGSSTCFKSSNPLSSSDGNNIASGFSTTSLWFKTTDNDQRIDEDMYLVDWSDNSIAPNDEHYRLLLTAGAAGSAGGKVQFHFAPSNNGLGETVICETTNDYDDNQWHHIVASRDGADDECRLTITNLDGTHPEPEINVNADVDEQNVEINGYRWHVGTNHDENGNFFKGYIDDIMHWDDTELDTGDKDDLARTNYGDGAHQFNLYLDVTDEDGAFLRNEYTGLAQVTAFADPKCISSCNDLDSAYTQTNMTMSIPTDVSLAAGERLELYFTWVPPTATWEALEVDMKIDDTSMINPYPSFMQFTEPDNPFPTYYEHDPNDEFEIFVSNVGDDGVYFTYSGTRVNFNGTDGSFAGLVHSVNGTGGGTGSSDWWNLNEDRDSLYIGPGEIGKLYFHEATDIPSTNESGNLMVDGSYHTTVWVNGYSNQGETFSRSVTVGSVEVVTP